MKVLIVKTSSLGDVIHTLPALTDAAQQLHEIAFDWLVEESLAPIPSWHPAVDRVIPIAWRRWRKQLWRAWRQQDLRRFIQDLRQDQYDLIIDAQGLFKSALPARLAQGKLVGYDGASIREKPAHWFYHHSYRVHKNQHAIERNRQLFALALGYDRLDSPPDYDLNLDSIQRQAYIVFLHGTTWSSKLWLESYWIALAQLAVRFGYGIKLPWLTQAEKKRAERIAQAVPQAEVLPPQSLTELRNLIAQAQGVVGVDTGLSHLSAALGTPGVTLYQSTDPSLTGVVGSAQSNLKSSMSCAPCLERECRFDETATIAKPLCAAVLSPIKVWSALMEQMQAE